MLKLMPQYHVTKTVVGDYGFKFFIMVKTVIGDYSFRLKVKTIVGHNGFEN